MIVVKKFLVDENHADENSGEKIYAEKIGERKFRSENKNYGSDGNFAAKFTRREKFFTEKPSGQNHAVQMTALNCANIQRKLFHVEHFRLIALVINFT